jgi:hypothetical protein
MRPPLAAAVDVPSGAAAVSALAGPLHELRGRVAGGDEQRARESLVRVDRSFAAAVGARVVVQRTERLEDVGRNCGANHRHHPSR